MVCAVAACVPTLLLPGHWSAVKSACVQRSAAFGSPTSPCGRTSAIDFRSSELELYENDRSIATFGCPPAVVVVGVSLTLVRLTAAPAPAGRSAAPAQAVGMAGARRPARDRPAPASPAGPV